MKLFFLILTSLIGFNSFAHQNLPEIVDINWQCYEGVGNLPKPAPLLDISGRFNTAQSRVFNDNEKSDMQVTIYDSEGTPLTLKPNQYELSWVNDGRSQDFIVEYNDSTYRIGTLPGNAILLEITPKSSGLFGRKKIKTGSC